LNQPGRAGVAAHSDNLLAGSMASMEAVWVHDWIMFAKERFGLAVSSNQMNGSDPPDAVAIVDGRNSSFGRFA
jgi:hypothetical protein